MNHGADLCLLKPPPSTVGDGNSWSIFSPSTSSKKITIASEGVLVLG